MPKNLLGFTVLGGLVGAAFVFGSRPNAPARQGVTAAIVGAAVGAGGAFAVSFLRADDQEHSAQLFTPQTFKNLGGVPGKRIPLATARRRG